MCKFCRTAKTKTRNDPTAKQRAAVSSTLALQVERGVGWTPRSQLWPSPHEKARECRLSVEPQHRGPPRSRVDERRCTEKVHRAHQRGRGVRYDELPRLVVVAGVPVSCAARTPFSTNTTFVRTVAGGVKGQNRWAGGRWHRAAPAGCAGSRTQAWSPHLPAHWTRARGRLSGLALPGGASALTDHNVLTHARRRVHRLKYDRR